MREYRYTVDRDGRIFHEGSEITDAAVLRFFLRRMERTLDGSDLVLCQGERNWFASTDTPFVVQRLCCHVDAGRLDAVELVFAGDYREPLDPATLETRAGHLYCTVHGGAFRARFGRIAMQQLSPHLTEIDGCTALPMGGTTHAIRDVDPIREA
jgi:hypothetical protein